MNIIVATIKSWNIKKALEMKEKFGSDINVTVIDSPSDLTVDRVKEIKPDFIFFPHWSTYIPEEIFLNYQCVVFHMTDLPFGRGGSPLQNLIVRGVKETKISAIKVVRELDAGPVYMKAPLKLEGTAQQIFICAADIIFDKMIPEIISGKIQPQEQEGEVVIFKRRKPEESELNSDMSLDTIYDYIRMLDCEGYPKANISFGRYKIKFHNAKKNDKGLSAQVEIEEV